MGESEGGSCGSARRADGESSDDAPEYCTEGGGPCMQGTSSMLARNPEFQKRINRVASRPDAEAFLVRHRKEKVLDQTTKALLVAGLKKDRFCRALDNGSIEQIVAQMEYFELESGDTIMQQGEHGGHFFVVEFGKVEIQLDERTIDHIRSGGSFGGIALLYQTKRQHSAIARETTGVWAANGSTFRGVLKEHSKKHYAENLKVLDQVKLFDGLSVQRKEELGKLAMLTEIYEPGKTVLRCGQKPSAMYVLKSGMVYYRSCEGERLQTLQAGECFGWRSVLYNEVECHDVVVEERCELVGIGVKSLRKCLGDDLTTCLLQAFFNSVAKKSQVFQTLHPKVVKFVRAEAEARNYEPDQEIEDDIVFAAVVDGHADIDRDGVVEGCRRGGRLACAHWEELERRLSGAKGPSPASVTLRSRGCRLVVLTKEGLGRGLKACELDFGSENTPMMYLEKALAIRSMGVFRELSIAQVNGMVNAMTVKQLGPDEEVFRQNAVAEALFVIFSGSITVDIDGNYVRTMGPGDCFGERALVLLERRSATCKAESEGVGLWVVERQTFRQHVPDSMLEQLKKNLNMYGKKHLDLKSLKHRRLVGVGAFGSVRLVEHKETAFRYALKRIRKEDGKVPPEFERECELLAENAHPFLLQFVEKFEGTNSIYILTEIITGGQLYQQVLEKMGVLSRRHAQFYIGSLALILECLHERCIVYRDLKPENVMLDSQGYVKLVDFGLAKRLGESDPRTFTISGTPHYMAPEVIGGHGYGVECDVWSLGVMFFELVCGDVPFGASAEDVPGILLAIVECPLVIPPQYNDNCGKKLIQGLLSKPVEKRLGARNGWDEIKTQKFFKQGVSGNLFSQIAGRELSAPLVPECEEFCNESSLYEQTTLSDAEELGADESTDLGNRLQRLFNRLDKGGTGKVAHADLRQTLAAANPTVFSDQVLDDLITMLDKQRKGVVSYEDFVAWMSGDNSEEQLKKNLSNALRKSIAAVAHTDELEPP